MSQILDFIKAYSLISCPIPYTSDKDEAYNAKSQWLKNNFFESLKLDISGNNGYMINLFSSTVQFLVLDADDEKSNNFIIQYCKDNNYNIVSTRSLSNIYYNKTCKNHYYFKIPKINVELKTKQYKEHLIFGDMDIIIRIAEHKDSTIDFNNISELTTDSIEYLFEYDKEETDEEETEDEKPREDHSEEKIEELLSLLNPSRGIVHSEWFSIGNTLKTINEDFFELFNRFCKCRAGYKKKKELLFRWNGFKKGGHIGVLINMAKADHPTLFKKWVKRWNHSIEFIEEAERTEIEIEEPKIEPPKTEEPKPEPKKTVIKEKEDIDEKAYTQMKQEQEINLFITTEPFCYYYINDEKKPMQYNQTDIRLLLAPLMIGKKSFIDLWTKDQNRRTYKKLDFTPLSTNPKIFNTFTGFKYENDDDINYNKIQPFLDLISELLNNEEVSIKAFLDWCGWIRQKPNVKTNKAIVLYSEAQGVGKNTIIQLLTSIFNGYTSKLEKIEDLVARFNSHFSSQLFIYGDEIQAKAREIREDLKNMITRDEIKVEKKGFDCFIMKDYSNYMFTTNNRDAFFIEETDRRFYMFDLNNKVMTDDTAKKLYKLLKDEETLLSFDTYLKTRQLPEELPKLSNKYKASLISYSLPAYTKMVYDNIDSFEEEEFTTIRLFKKAQQYAKENAMQWTFSKDKFLKDFKKEFGEFRFRRSNQIFYKFPVKETFIKLLIEKRKELMSDYIPPEDLLQITELEPKAEKHSDLNL
jgi:hypothetical protein